MYEKFYGLREKPFGLSPDPAFLYPSRKHSVALSMLEYSLENRAGISVMTGEIGSGKTTLIRHLLGSMGNKVTVGLISNTHNSFGNLMQWVCNAFDIPAGTDSKALLHEAFVKFMVKEYAQGRHTVLVVDEAQNLELETLEELRLLSNINADKHLVLQTLLVGQPELRIKLRNPSLTQFVQRIAVDFHLGPLLPEETEAYIRHRLQVAGGEHDLFTHAAMRYVHYQTGGVPRLINSLCDTALIYGFAEGLDEVRVQLVHELVSERIREGLFGAGLVVRADDDTGLLLEIAEANLARSHAETADTVGPAPGVCKVAS